MSETEQALFDAGEKLARSLGHKADCPRAAPAMPECHCGGARLQAEALVEWEALKRKLRGE